MRSGQKREKKKLTKEKRQKEGQGDGREKKQQQQDGDGKKPSTLDCQEDREEHEYKQWPAGPRWRN
ncbi:hypothetical protein FK515_30350 [Klebsiella pneumoniae]|nr:hypothetical protein [Klebsiella pneumoniae]